MSHGNHSSHGSHGSHNSHSSHSSHTNTVNRNWASSDPMAQSGTYAGKFTDATGKSKLERGQSWLYDLQRIRSTVGLGSTHTDSEIAKNKVMKASTINDMGGKIYKKTGYWDISHRYAECVAGASSMSGNYKYYFTPNGYGEDSGTLIAGTSFPSTTIASGSSLSNANNYTYTKGLETLKTMWKGIESHTNHESHNSHSSHGSHTSHGSHGSYSDCDCDCDCDHSNHKSHKNSYPEYPDVCGCDYWP